MIIPTLKVLLQIAASCGKDCYIAAYHAMES